MRKKYITKKYIHKFSPEVKKYIRATEDQIRLGNDDPHTVSKWWDIIPDDLDLYGTPFTDELIDQVIDQLRYDGYVEVNPYSVEEADSGRVLLVHLTYEEAMQAVRAFEARDRSAGIYSEGSYRVVHAYTGENTVIYHTYEYSGQYDEYIMQLEEQCELRTAEEWSEVIRNDLTDSLDEDVSDDQIEEILVQLEDDGFLIE